MSSQLNNPDIDFAAPAKRIKISDEAEFLSTKYESIHDHYSKEGLDQQIHLFLRRIASSSEVPSELRHIPLLRMLTEVCKELMLNELEISMWSIFLEKVVWTHLNVLSVPLNWLLLFSAYSAKQYLNEDVYLYESYMQKKHENFLHNYQNWLMNNHDLMKVSPKKLNSKYLFLSIPPSADESEIIDYNYYVDDILQIAPPSNSNEKEIKIEIPSIIIESDEPKLPELLTLNSVLVDAAETPDIVSGKKINHFEHFQPAIETDIDIPMLLPGLSRIQSTIKEEEI